MFVLSFKNGDNDATRNSFDKYYISLKEIKDFIALIDNKPFSYQPLKSKQEAFEKLVEMSRNDDCKTGHLLHYLYHQKYYEVICTDLSRQTNTTIPQQIYFIGKLEKKAAKNYPKRFFRSINCNRII